jgi:hypothetical protein
MEEGFILLFLGLLLRDVLVDVEGVFVDCWLLETGAHGLIDIKLGILVKLLLFDILNFRIFLYFDMLLRLFILFLGELLFWGIYVLLFIYDLFLNYFRGCFTFYILWLNWC